MATWQKLLSQLPWTHKHAERSTRLALSKAQGLGIDKDKAMRAVFKMWPDGFFRENPHIPYQVWQSVSEQIAQPDVFELLAA